LITGHILPSQWDRLQWHELCYHVR
jgi:hypothetical protein